MSDILFRETISSLLPSEMDTDFWDFLMARYALAYKKKTAAEVKGLFYATFPNFQRIVLDEICRYAFEDTHPGQAYRDSTDYPSYVFGSTYSWNGTKALTRVYNKKILEHNTYFITSIVKLKLKYNFTNAFHY